MCTLLFLKLKYINLCSLAVSIKMNVLLFAPGLLVVYVTSIGWHGTVRQLTLCALIQAILAAPFIMISPMAYFNGAFNFGRIFLYEWTVNWRILPEWIFSHRLFHILLLVLQLMMLLAFALKHWTRSVALASVVHCFVDGYKTKMCRSSGVDPLLRWEFVGNRAMPKQGKIS